MSYQVKTKTVFIADDFQEFQNKYDCLIHNQVCLMAGLAQTGLKHTVFTTDSAPKTIAKVLAEKSDELNKIAQKIQRLKVDKRRAEEFAKKKASE